MSFVGDAIAAYYAEQLVKAIAVVAIVVGVGLGPGRLGANGKCSTPVPRRGFHG